MQVFFHPIDGILQKADPLGSKFFQQCGGLCSRRSRQPGADVQEIGLNQPELLTDVRTCRRQNGGKASNGAVELIHITVSFHLKMAFGYPLSAK
jgi:hypothetical protein